MAIEFGSVYVGYQSVSRQIDRKIDSPDPRCYTRATMRYIRSDVSYGILLIALLTTALAAGPIPEQDSRNTYIPFMDTHFQMPVFANHQAWLAKAAFLRKQILSSAGL